jgi:hypothetical protein
MLRATFTLLAALTFSWAPGVADDSKGTKSKDENRIIATFVKADVAKNMVTFKYSDKSGKPVELKLVLDKNAKVMGTGDKPESLSDFVKNMERRRDKSIIVVEDKEHQHIVQLKDIDSF